MVEDHDAHELIGNIPVHTSAAVLYSNGDLHIVADKQHYRYSGGNLDGHNFDSNYPVALSDKWPGIMDDTEIDAATKTDGKYVYLFTGTKYYVYDSVNQVLLDEVRDMVTDYFQCPIFPLSYVLNKTSEENNKK